jgi:hypothetical protein
MTGSKKPFIPYSATGMPKSSLKTMRFPLFVFPPDEDIAESRTTTVRNGAMNPLNWANNPSKLPLFDRPAQRRKTPEAETIF